MNILTMCLPITPTPQRRVRFASRGEFSKTYKDKKQVKNEDFLMHYLQPYVPTVPILGAIELKTKMVFPVPSSKSDWWNKAAMIGDIKHVTTGDIDNCLKNIMDVMQSMRFYKNDSQIFKATAEKQYSDVGIWIITLIEYPVPASKKEYVTSNYLFNSKGINP